VEEKRVPTAEQMRSVLNRYLQGVTDHDVDAVLALLDDDVSVEDPVGGSAGTHVVGRDAVGEFFRNGFSRSQPHPTLTGPIHTTLGREAAMAFTLGLTLGGQASEVDVIDVVEFNDAGKIVRLRAFWNPNEIRPAG